MNPVGVPVPPGITPPAPVPVIGTDIVPGVVGEPCPPSTFTLPIASVPSWQDRHSLELPPG